MKHASQILFSCIAVVLTGLVACKNDTATEPPFLEVGKTSILFQATAGSDTVEVRSNRTFTAVSNQPEWCSATVAEGQLIVSVSANPAEADRRASVTVSVEGVSPAVIDVAQSFTATIRIPDEYAALNFPGNTGGQRSIPVQTTGNKPFMASSDQTWCAVAVAGFTLNVNVEPNIPGEPARSANITLSGEGMKDLVIRAEQSAFAGYVRIADDSHLSHHVKGETNTSVYVTILNNTPYEVASNKEWCTIERFDSEAKHQVKIAVSKNETGAVRTAQINVTGGAEPLVITLTQDAANHQTGFPRFAVLSDTHFDNREGNGEASDVKVSRALQNLTLKNGKLDAIFDVGDVTDHGQPDEYDHMLAVFTNPQYVPQDVPVYYLMGNHDNSQSAGEYNYLAKTRQPMNQYLEIKGYPFITISQTGGNSMDYNHAAQRFLRESLKDAETNYPGKPIFVFVHVPPQNTCYGSGASDGWGSAVFPPLLEPYPQVIVFAGHSHFPLGDPRSIWQGKYTSVNDGSTTYSELEPNIVSDGIHPADYNKVTEGLIVNLKDGGNTVEMERWDTRRNEEILPRWTVRAPYDGSNFDSEYRGRTGTPPPVFAANAVDLITIAQSEGKWLITFPQASDNEVVHHYIVNVRNVAGNEIVQTQKRFSLYYLNSDMPNRLTVEFSGLPTDRQLKTEIIAVDAYYDKQSQPVVKQFP